MGMSLDKWQERLERHFESIARTRAGSGFPIFALEHGLHIDEIEEISSLLLFRLKSRLPFTPHWLLWLIYATERGYSYKGDEYWLSFEEQTPHWEFADRTKVFGWFWKFCEAYDGVIPSGPWATHFRIIAWPITHAILPKYLQYQFAKALYNLRWRLASSVSLVPASLGRLLVANIQHPSSRFREFLQQEELAGRIVLALLGEAPAEGMEPIYKPTLQRIISDLEEIQSARDWLNETRTTVRDRFKGISNGTWSTRPHTIDGDSDPILSNVARLNIRPNLMLRHSGGGTWSVVLEISSFKDVAELNADLQSFLQSTRCRLNGAADFKPGGWLLSRNRKGILKIWPDNKKPLIQFEQKNSKLELLLDSECQMSPGPVWLFRLASDGTAREIIGRIVRPNCSYVIVTTDDLPRPHDCAIPCKIDCMGVKALRLSMPPNVLKETNAWLDQLGLQVARTIRIWPAGLPGRGWDGEGSSEWLTTETPCFGIAHDHPLDSYVVRLNYGAEATIKAEKMGHPTFIRIASLPVGRHLLAIKAHQNNSRDALTQKHSLEGFVELKVREPEPWIPGNMSHSGLIVSSDPHDPDLDTFWRNEVRLWAYGPESYTVAFAVSLQARDGREILAAPVGGPMNLPVTPETWRKSFGQFLEHEDHAWSYLGAASGRLTIMGEALGECSLTFEHEARPLRWALQRHHGSIFIRLVDDTGQEQSEPTILFFHMENPLKGIRFSADEGFSGIEVEPAGGLFFAMHGRHFDSIVVSTGLTANGLKGLGVQPNFSELRRGLISIADALISLCFWHDSRLYGFLVNIRYQTVLDGLHRVILGALCGYKWIKAEDDFLNNQKSPQMLSQLKRAVGHHPGFCEILSQNYSRMKEGINKVSRWYEDMAARFGVCEDRNLCNFALRLSCQSLNVSDTFNLELNQMIKKIKENPIILRGARLLRLLNANQNCE